MTPSPIFLILGGILGILANLWFGATGVIVLCGLLLTGALIDALR